jgi:DNA-binding NarL/FixJ family response regulator
MEPYRILLADDHEIFRELIRKGLAEITGMEVIGEVSDGLELLESLETLTPHLIIIDIGMPNISGIEAAKRIKKLYPDIKILLLTMYKSKEHLKFALEAGVDGYLLKGNAFRDLITAIRTIREENLYLSPLLSRVMMDGFVEMSKTKPGPTKRLSGREIKVLKYHVEGKKLKEIAELLSVSKSTVSSHLAKIKSKLSIKGNADLVKYALTRGYASIDM